MKSEEDTDLKALEAAALYAQDATFAAIAKELGTSKSHAQVLVRKGIELSLKEMAKSNPGEVTHENPEGPRSLEALYPPRSDAYPSPFPIDPRSGNYTLETTGIGRRVMLTPKCLMIYDLWVGSGFEGDLSDFLEDAVDFLYNSRRPAERPR